jgi:hypothetical protein
MGAHLNGLLPQIAFLANSSRPLGQVSGGSRRDRGRICVAPPIFHNRAPDKSTSRRALKPRKTTHPFSFPSSHL